MVEKKILRTKRQKVTRVIFELLFGVLFAAELLAGFILTNAAFGGGAEFGYAAIATTGLLVAWFVAFFFKNNWGIIIHLVLFFMAPFVFMLPFASFLGKAEKQMVTEKAANDQAKEVYHRQLTQMKDCSMKIAAGAQTEQKEIATYASEHFSEYESCANWRSPDSKLAVANQASPCVIALTQMYESAGKKFDSWSANSQENAWLDKCGKESFSVGIRPMVQGHLFSNSRDCYDTLSGYLRQHNLDPKSNSTIGNNWLERCYNFAANVKSKCAAEAQESKKSHSESAYYTAEIESNCRRQLSDKILREDYLLERTELALASSVNVAPREQQCLDVLNAYAKQHSIESASYIAQNRAWLQQCIGGAK